MLIYHDIVVGTSIFKLYVKIREHKRHLFAGVHCDLVAAVLVTGVDPGVARGLDGSARTRERPTARCFTWIHELGENDNDEFKNNVIFQHVNKIRSTLHSTALFQSFQQLNHLNHKQTRL